MLNYEEFIGQTFNYLKVLELINPPNHIKDKRIYFKCECLKCGKIKTINSKNVRNGSSKSCGCLHVGMKQGRTLNKYEELEDCFVGTCSDGTKFYVDKQDYEKIKEYTWHTHEGNYIRTCLYSKMRKNTYSFLHNFILGEIPSGFVVDHIDGDPTKNKRENLRVVEQINNMKNLKKYSNNTSGTKGVCYLKNEGKWHAYITYDKNRINLGKYVSKEDAIKVRKEAELKYFGEFNRKEDNLNNVHHT
jgi:hypothetical protein